MQHRPITASDVNIDRLLVFAVKRIDDAGEECTFERLVYECFTLFPGRFGFQRYPDWPDSARVNKAWLRCRTDHGWISGNVKEGFRLTPAGRAIAIGVGRQLQTGGPIKRAHIPQKTRERYEAILKYVKNSQEFRGFAAGTLDGLPPADLRSFLGGTLETPKRILRHNLNLYMNAARIYKDPSVLEFLEFCKKEAAKLKR